MLKLKPLNYPQSQKQNVRCKQLIEVYSKQKNVFDDERKIRRSSFLRQILK